MLKKINVRVTRKDTKDHEKESSSFEDLLINTEVIMLVTPVVGTKTSLIKLINGEALLAKGDIYHLESMLND